MSVAPLGPTVMPGAVGMTSPLEVIVEGVDASAGPPPEELLPEEPDEVVVVPPPEPPPLLPPLLLDGAVLPLELPLGWELFALPPLLPLVMSGPWKPPVLGAGELQARKPKASPRLAPKKARFTFGFDVRIMTPPPSFLGFVRGATDNSPARPFLSLRRLWAMRQINQSQRNYRFF
jgi:hypothetical protein